MRKLSIAVSLVLGIGAIMLAFPADWAGGTPPAGTGIPVTAIYFHPGNGESGDPTEYIGIWSGTTFYNYNYDPTDLVQQTRAAEILSLLEKARQVGANVFLYRPDPGHLSLFSMVIMK